MVGVCRSGASGLTRKLSVRQRVPTTQTIRFGILSTIRYHSSRGKRGQRRGFQLDALPFTVSPSEAHAKFESWAHDEQGLRALLSIGGTTNITAAYAPYWYFDLNIRFVPPRGGSYNSVTPEPFRSAFPNPPHGVIHVPGLAAYAGFSYRRSLIDPVHNTTLVFMKKDIVPFGQWMLEPLKYNGQTLEIYPDPWNATRERAFSVIYDELHDIANNEQNKSDTSTASDEETMVETERLRSRRIYMPTYIVEYSILGIPYRACISGCDASVQVSGVSHKTTIFASGSAGDGLMRGANSFLSNLPGRAVPAAASALQFFGPRPFLGLAQIAATAISRVAMKFHLVGPFVGAFVAWRKVFQPYMDERSAAADWERRREYEAQKNDSYVHEDSFRDTGSAKSYFTRNREKILRSLSGEEGRHHDDDEESVEWYKQWEQWAREQWEQAQREASRAQGEWQRQQQQHQEWQQHQQNQGQRTYQQQQQQQQQQQRGQQRQYKQANKEEFQWDFDVNDPWSVLGIPRNSSKEEVSKAFRREMLKHHPDVNSRATEKEKMRATERSKLISNAYRKIKAGFKR